MAWNEIDQLHYELDREREARVRNEDYEDSQRRARQSAAAEQCDEIWQAITVLQERMTKLEAEIVEG